MKVGFIGAGKVGTSFGLFLSNKGVNITGFFSRRYDSAKHSAYLTNSKAYKEKINLVKDSDIIFITTNDDSIKKVVEEINNSNINLNNKVISHMSGVLDSTILRELMEKEATIASLHPMYPFSNIDHSIKKLKDTIFTLEGNGKHFEDIKLFLEDIPILYQEIKTNQKILYHAAACIASNYLVTLLNTSIELLKITGFDEKNAINLIKNLVLQTINNIFVFGPQDALTGPILRGDVDTVSKHLNKLKDIENKEWLRVYQILGLSTLNLVEKRSEVNKELLTKLKKELKK